MKRRRQIIQDDFDQMQRDDLGPEFDYVDTNEQVLDLIAENRVLIAEVDCMYGVEKQKETKRAKKLEKADLINESIDSDDLNRMLDEVKDFVPQKGKKSSNRFKTTKKTYSGMSGITSRPINSNQKRVTFNPRPDSKKSTPQKAKKPAHTIQISPPTHKRE